MLFACNQISNATILVIEHNESGRRADPRGGKATVSVRARIKMKRGRHHDRCIPDECNWDN